MVSKMSVKVFVYRPNSSLTTTVNIEAHTKGYYSRYTFYMLYFKNATTVAYAGLRVKKENARQTI